MKPQAGPLFILMKVGLHRMRRARTVMHPLARDVMARMTGMRQVVSTQLER
jgi:hypothetical protein